MIDSNVLHEVYERAAREEKELKSEISKQTAIDIATLFVNLMCFNPKFIDLMEPYRNSRKERVLTWLNVKEEEIIIDEALEDIKLRLANDSSNFRKIDGIFHFCCLNGGDNIATFQKYIYQDEYENFIKYNTSK